MNCHTEDYLSSRGERVLWCISVSPYHIRRSRLSGRTAVWEDPGNGPPVFVDHDSRDSSGTVLRTLGTPDVLCWDFRAKDKKAMQSRA